MDALLAIDFDGFALPPGAGHPPRIVCPQGIFAEMAGTEPEPFRRLLGLQAELENRNLRAAAAIVVPSRCAAESISRCYGVQVDRIDIVPHGFDHQGWAKLVDRHRMERARGRNILTVAKLYPRKGIDLLIEAAVPLDQQWIDAGTWEVEVADKRYPALVSIAPLYDPGNVRIKG